MAKRAALGCAARAAGVVPVAEHVDEGDELAGEVPQPVEFENDEDVTAAQIVEARR